MEGETEELDLEIGRLLVEVYRAQANHRLANHLSPLREDLFRFLLQPGLEGTSWAAVTELRYAVVNRKTCGGGNRTEAGAVAQAILITLSRTRQATLPRRQRALRPNPPCAQTRRSSLPLATVS